MTEISFKNWYFLPGFYIVSGHPATYAEYFSLNKTTAELRVLQPINRDLYQRFTLIIKVIKNNHLRSSAFMGLLLHNLGGSPSYLSQRLIKTGAIMSKMSPLCLILANFGTFTDIGTFSALIFPIGIVPPMIVLLCLHTW